MVGSALLRKLPRRSTEFDYRVHSVRHCDTAVYLLLIEVESRVGCTAMRLYCRSQRVPLGFRETSGRDKGDCKINLQYPLVQIRSCCDLSATQ